MRYTENMRLMGFFVLCLSAQLGAAGLVSQAWENAKKASVQLEPKSGTSSEMPVITQIKFVIERIRKELTERPDTSSSQTGCVERKISSLDRLVQLTEGAYAALETAIRTNDSDTASIYRIKIREAQKKALSLEKDSSYCYATNINNLATKESADEATLRNNVSVSEPLLNTVNAPGQPVVLTENPASPAQ